MSPAFAFFTFLNAWWIMLFIALPFSTKYPESNEEKPPANEAYTAAPKEIYWKRAFVIATILATIVTAVLAVVVSVAR